MPVPDIESVGSQLELEPLGHSDTLHQGEILILVAETSQVGDPGTNPIIIVESIHRLKSSNVKQRLVGIEASIV